MGRFEKFIYGKYKDPLPKEVHNPLLDPVRTKLNFESKESIDTIDTIRHRRIFRRAPEFHFYETVYGRDHDMLYLYCIPEEKIIILNEMSGILNSSNELLNSCTGKSDYNLWGNIPDENETVVFNLVLGLKNMKMAYKRAHYLYEIKL